MKRFMLLGLLAVLSAFVLTGCAGGAEGEVRGVVAGWEQTFEDGLNGKASITTLDSYYATAEEGANAAGLVNTREAFRKMAADHSTGTTLIQLSNFHTTNVQVHESAGLAKVTYQFDVRMVHGAQQGTATLMQDLALLKTPTSGWRIRGGDAFQFSNVVGQLP